MIETYFFMFTNLHPEIITYLGKGHLSCLFSKIKHTGYLGANDILVYGSGGA